MSTGQVAVLGGSLSGNKGAAAMALALMDGLREHADKPSTVLFTPYPEADLRAAGGLDTDVDVVAFRPVDMVLRVLPAAVASLATGRRWRPKRGPAGRLAAADVAADVSGISFMAGRGVWTLGYNVLLVWLPWAFGVPVVKVSQAMGPFGRGLTRTAARATLARCRWVGARGAGTAAYLRELGVPRVEQVPDVAFLLEPGAAAEEWAAAQIPDRDRVVLVMPSQVVAARCEEIGLDYPGLLADLLRALAEAGYDVCVVAHSARTGAPAGHTNDLPLCRQLAASVPGVRLCDGEVDARALRALVARARLLLTSRFHGMVSGLATGTPTVVMGWSHKYDEVLADFGLDDVCVDFRQLRQDALLATVLSADATREAIRATTTARLPDVLDLAYRNVTRVAEATATTVEGQAR